MESILTVLPELKSVWGETVPAPAVGPGNVTTLELEIQRFDSIFEDRTARERLALLARVGAELAASCPGREVRVRLRRRHFLDVTFNADLATEGLAVPKDRRAGIGFEFLALA